MTRLASLCIAVAATAGLSACVFAPPSSAIPADTSTITKIGEQAVITCGAGNVKEVNAKSFTCK
ncbi:hypothetical protein [Pelomonas cellulosilytica]|uniref:Uncharacterized protein n=1 Tax=Pelomonas cellulosilytica TaxID=2906762 RepID=A0ABS8Y485_9BURK|nr:hypothetical protein [Pelomonas sp. P8]MCE4558117.1 hypothetical protein [Pelomonas sp. P8]